MQSTSRETDAGHAGEELQASWQTLRDTFPTIRIRDAASRLNVSELELLVLNCGRTVTRLSADFTGLIQSLPSLGPVMALTRNDHAVHEKRGRYRNIKIADCMGLVLDENIDLRLFLNHWHSSFAVTEQGRDGERQSLQFLDRYGGAVHKIYLTESSKLAAYEDLVERFAAADQSPRQPVTPRPQRRPDRPDLELNRAGLVAAWRELQDTHDFYPMLKQQGVGRLQALRLAERDLAFPVSNASADHVLKTAAGEGIPIMVFVGSPGVIQIHTGPVRAIQRTGAWINVLDEDFNLHLRDERVASSWVVRKPTADGIVTSLELYDDNDDLIVQFFGKRKPGTAELGLWRDLLGALPQASGPAWRALA